MRISPIDFREVGRVSRMLLHDAVMSPLRKYVLYSVIIHVLVIGIFSLGMVLPARQKPAAPAQAPEPAAPAPATEAAAPAAEKKPDEASGRKEDYYSREGVDTTPAAPEEIPKNPFEAKDEINKTLERL